MEGGTAQWERHLPPGCEPEFCPQDTHGRKRDFIPISGYLTLKHAPWHTLMNTCVHTHTK